MNTFLTNENTGQQHGTCDWLFNIFYKLNALYIEVKSYIFSTLFKDTQTDKATLWIKELLTLQLKSLEEAKYLRLSMRCPITEFQIGIIVFYEFDLRNSYLFHWTQSLMRESTFVVQTQPKILRLIFHRIKNKLSSEISTQEQI